MSGVESGVGRVLARVSIWSRASMSSRLCMRCSMWVMGFSFRGLGILCYVLCSG